MAELWNIKWSPLAMLMVTGLGADETPAADDLEPDVGSELSVVPLDKDGFGLCERCGTVGLRKNFYVRDNKYCSLMCFRSWRSKRGNFRFTLMESTDHLTGMIPMEPLPQLARPWPADLHDLVRPNPPKQLAAAGYEWKDELFGCEFLAAPVKLFKHAPLHDMWDSTLVGMKVEVRNTDAERHPRLADYFWVATVVKVKGYMGLLRYEGFGSDDSKDFWLNLCCSDVHPVGWCATRGAPLIPPRGVEHRHTDWKRFLVRQLTGARTLPVDFYTRLEEGLRSRFAVGARMEVVDKDRITQVKVASVYEIIGKRLHVKYYDSRPEDEGFWCHEESPLIHPVGWAFAVGHPLAAPADYCERVAAGRLLPGDTTPGMFFRYPDIEPKVPLFREGMKLEAIDPLNLSSVCAATVMRVLREGYMMIRIDVYPADVSNSDWFCYHQRSPCIFPVGFSAANNIRLVPPAGYTPENFSWSGYLATCGAPAAGAELFAARSSVEHGFVAGMRLECADLMGPQLVCVATVARVVANMLKVHFDGWGDEYDQWLWGHSTDMYPVGWCRAVGHRLEGPQAPAPPPRAPPRPARRARPYSRKRKLARATKDPATRNGTQANITAEENSQSLSPLEDTKPPTPNPEDLKPLEPISEDIKSLSPKEDSVPSPAAEDIKQHSPDTDAKDVSSNGTERVSPKGLTPDTADQESRSSVASSQESEPVGLSGLDSGQAAPEENGKEAREQSLPKESIPDLPDSPNDECPEEESCIENEPQSDKVIPRLVNNASIDRETLSSIDPENWTTADVSRFLAVNDCSAYSASFAHVTGAALLQLTKDGVLALLSMRVGPSLKIYDLIQQLKCKIKTRLKFN